MTLREQLRARWSLLEFYRRMKPATAPVIVGRHTREITARIDQAIEDYRQGRSSYLVITVPFRHGKSDIVSRHLPPYFLGHFPDDEIMLATYGQELSNKMSRYARGIIRSAEYREIFPAIRLSGESASVQNWSVAGHGGKLQAITISAGGTGNGANLLIVDDYMRGRSVAESPLIRDTQWDNFSGNLMTRLAPAHIVIILATPWHPDDIIGRIKNAIDPASENRDEDFPPFEVMKFPARAEDGTYLFPERFSVKWYERQFAMLGNYQAAALLQCDPQLRGGNMLRTDRVQVVNPGDWPEGIRWVRFWDLASGAKERIKDDPDSTVGAKLGLRKIDGLWHLYIDDIRMCQDEAIKRNRMIEQAADDDGPSVRIGVEAVAGYKDTATTLKHILGGRSVVTAESVSSDKVARAGEIEPLFDAGHIYIRKAWWNRAFLDQLGSFPAGTHDDIVDAVSGGFIMARRLYGGSRAITV